MAAPLATQQCVPVRGNYFYQQMTRLPLNCITCYGWASVWTYKGQVY